MAEEDFALVDEALQLAENYRKQLDEALDLIDKYRELVKHTAVYLTVLAILFSAASAVFAIAAMR